MATRGVSVAYQEVVDLHTESDRVTAIGVHTPTGSFPRQMFRGFFDQYKKYKYLGCSISLVPAARLPADPSQVSFEAGENAIDPRDLMNPIMFHGCHGDDLGTVLNKLYGDDNGISDSIVGIDYGDDTPIGTPDVLERLYYKALTDKSWKKAHPMRGFRKSGLHPLVYSLAVNRQIMPASIPTGLSDRNMLGFDDNGVFGVANGFGDPSNDFEMEMDGNVAHVTPTVKNNLQFMTPRLVSLGWIETRNVITAANPYDDNGQITEEYLSDLSQDFKVNYAELPKLFMGVILLPPAYKTEQYFRMIINHHFAFKQFRGISFQPSVTGVPTYWNKNPVRDGTEYVDTPLFGLENGHFGDLNNDGDTPFDPTPTPDPDPEVETRDVMINLAVYSAANAFGLYSLSYEIDGVTTLYRSNIESEVSATSKFFEMKDIPVGATILGTVYTMVNGVRVYDNLADAITDFAQSDTFNHDGITYTNNKSWIVNSNTNQGIKAYLD